MDLKSVLRAQWDRVIAVLFVLGGLVALLVGYLGVSDTPYVAAQLPYIISGGLVGIFFLSLGIGLWLSADLRDDWRELRACRLVLEDAGVSGAVGRFGSNGVEDTPAPAQVPARRQRPLVP